MEPEHYLGASRLLKQILRIGCHDPQRLGRYACRLRSGYLDLMFLKLSSLIRSMVARSIIATRVQGLAWL